MDFGAATTALTVLSGMMGMATKANEREYNQHLIELQKAILQMQQDMVAMQQTNVQLAQEVRELKAEQELSKALEYDGYMYWRQVGDSWDGPFCASCRDLDKKLVRPTFKGEGKYRHQDFESRYYECPVHREIFIPVSAFRDR